MKSENCSERLPENSFLGSTGDSPVPSGDSPDGTGAAVPDNKDGLLGSLRSAVPVGGSPTGAGESPALPKQRLHLKCFTAIEILHFAWLAKKPVREVLSELRAAGLDSLTGGGAEIFREPTRSMICAHKCDGNRWLELSGKVHAAGLKTNATMLYGHIESVEDRVDHLLRLRAQQDESHGFQCLIPLAFYPENTQLAHLPGPSGVDSLKTMAVSRLLLDNFDHLKAYWVMLGKRLAQVALHYGANDIDGTITDGGELSESYSIESNNEVKMSRSELVSLIDDAGFEAVERDTIYNPIERSNVSLV